MKDMNIKYKLTIGLVIALLALRNVSARKTKNWHRQVFSF